MTVSGSGSKVFVAGAKLLASEVNGYLMRQSMMQFDTTTARDAAITGTGEGPHCYTADKDQVWYYNGSAWVMKEGWGTGSPEGLVTSSLGGVWHRTDGAAGTTLYVKESGTGATGWVAHGGSTAITSASGTLGADVSLTTTGGQTILTTSSLATGTWMFTYDVFIASQANLQHNATVVTNTATATIAGPPGGTCGNTVTSSNDFGSISRTVIITVTVAGTFDIVINISSNVGSTARKTTWNGGYLATGYTAIKIA